MMKNLLFAAFVFAPLFTAGCATQRSPAIKAIDAAAFCEANAGLDYAACRPRDTEEELKAALIADITLMDVEEATARRMLDLRGANDISPRSVKHPLGETLAAYIGMNDVGEVLLRPSVAVAPGSPLHVEYHRDFAYLADYKLVTRGEAQSWQPVVQSVWVGARAAIEIKARGDGGHQVSVTSESGQVMRPVPTFTTSLGLAVHKVQAPQLASPKRVATQDLQPGETAVFVLSSVQGENPVVRLLFVRLEKP